jgi:hypothetical protein
MRFLFGSAVGGCFWIAKHYGGPNLGLGCAIGDSPAVLEWSLWSLSNRALSLYAKSLLAPALLPPRPCAYRSCCCLAHRMDLD